MGVLEEEERETETKSVKCRALSDISVVIAVLIADGVHCLAEVKVVE